VIWLLVLLGIVLLLAIVLVVLYNRLVRLRNAVDNSWAQVEVQLKRRWDLIPNLVETVKGYAAHEREVFEEVTNARAGAEAASGVRDQARAEDQLTAGIRRLIAVAENYPQLKANENFLALQEELTGTESKIAFARQFYNDQVAALNTLIQSFPPSLVARIGRFEEREFFDIEEPVRGPVGVRF
jgi:LemA protein